MKQEIITIIVISIIFLILSGIFLVPFALSYYFPDKEGYKCSNFISWEQADMVFKKNPKDIYDLDRNHNGIPCESLKQK